MRETKHRRVFFGALCVVAAGGALAIPSGCSSGDNGSPGGGDSGKGNIIVGSNSDGGSDGGSGCGRLSATQVLALDQPLTSCDGRYQLKLQSSDGNLVLYKGSAPLWSPFSSLPQPSDHAIMQGDGNFVVVSGQNTALWATNTPGHDGAYLVLQNDGNLVVVDPSNPQGPALWASNTAEYDTTKDTAFDTTKADRQKTGFDFDDINATAMPRASVMSRRFCSDPLRGFPAGFPTAQEENATGGKIGVVCFSNDSYVFTTNQSDMINTKCNSADTSPDPGTSPWAETNCIAGRLCVNKGPYVGGLFDGETGSQGHWDVVCLTSNAVTHHDVAPTIVKDATKYPDHFTDANDIDQVSWQQATRLAGEICADVFQSKLKAGYFNGEHNSTAYGVLCYP